MRFEISGKGVVCNVYYIEREKLDEISTLTNETGPGLKELLQKHSDHIVNVSRGFFSDSSLFDFNLQLSSGAKISKELFEKEFLVEDGEDEEDWDDIDAGLEFSGYSLINHAPREKDATSTQVGIVEYHDFESGTICIDVEECDEGSFKTLKLLCESVDRSGPSGMDLATTATYLEGAVGGEEYQSAECAINGIQIAGKDYALPEATFEKSHSRVWLWVYDDESGEHSLDFFGSQALADPWVVDLVDLKLNDFYEKFDQDHSHLRSVHKFFNQQSLEWIKENPEYTSMYLKNHTSTQKLLGQSSEKLELPDFMGENRTLDICTLLCMFLEAFGISGYDPQKLSALDEFEMELEDLETHTLGNELLLKSLKQSFCMHFDVISTISFGEESFQEMSHPSLADAIRFVEEVLDDPEASFNQK
ncbi:hypothetical protein N9370_01540 [Paracoccaceae bacterium]|nr:hypothetical protein [Paracoccaceae bacterium]